LILVLGSGFLALLGALQLQTQVAQADGWGPWNCHWTVLNYPVTGGLLSGRTCPSYWQGSGFSWRLWGDTYAPWSDGIDTQGYGYDRCGTNPFTLQIETYNRNYNTTYGTSGSPVSGVYQDCPGTGHDYLIQGAHNRFNPWEGTWGYW